MHVFPQLSLRHTCKYVYSPLGSGFLNNVFFGEQTCFIIYQENGDGKQHIITICLVSVVLEETTTNGMMETKYSLEVILGRLKVPVQTKLSSICNVVDFISHWMLIKLSRYNCLAPKLYFPLQQLFFFSFFKC